MGAREEAMARSLRRKEDQERYARDDNDFQYVVDMFSGVQAHRDTARWGKEQGGVLAKIGKLQEPLQKIIDPTILFR